LYLSGHLWSWEEEEPYKVAANTLDPTRAYAAAHPFLCQPMFQQPWERKNDCLMSLVLALRAHKSVLRHTAGSCIASEIDQTYQHKRLICTWDACKALRLLSACRSYCRAMCRYAAYSTCSSQSCPVHKTMQWQRKRAHLCSAVQKSLLRPARA